MLTLHIRFVNMRNCAFILMSSLPAAWLVVGCLLLLLLVVVTILFLLKSREVVTLKKQCEDLRETMRMMRYEEANLARMLHTASKKPEEPIAEFEDSESLVALAEEPTKKTFAEFQKNEESQLAEDTQTDEELRPAENEELVEKNAEEEALAEVCQEPIEISPSTNEEFEEEDTEVAAEEGDSSAESEDEQDALESDGELIEEIEASQELVEIPQPHKNPINERKPAIPTDLFAVWFAENDELEDESSVIEPSLEVAFEESKEPASEKELVEASEVEGVVVVETSGEVSMCEETSSVVCPEVDVDALSSKVKQETNSVQEVELNKEDERFCRKLERIVTTRLRNPNLNIDIIAAQFGIGRTNFYRKVRELTGMSPNDYLRKYRMERAVELLGKPDLTISEVCAQVGIPDAQYFSRVFKAYYGMSPSVYRENINQ